VRVHRDRVVQPDGVESSYTVIEEPAGAVMVVAVTDDGRIVFLRQHRHPVDSVTIELPAGEVPVGVDPLEQARRELNDETGVSASTFTMLGRVATWPARLRRWSDVVLARGLDGTGLSHLGQDGDEAIEEALLIEPGRVRQLVAEGSILDASTLSALTLYWKHDPLDRRGPPSRRARHPNT